MLGEAQPRSSRSRRRRSRSRSLRRSNSRSPPREICFLPRQRPLRQSHRALQLQQLPRCQQWQRLRNQRKCQQPLRRPQRRLQRAARSGQVEMLQQRWLPLCRSLQRSRR